MRPLRLLLSGFLMLIGFLSKHAGFSNVNVRFSNVRYNAQHGDSHCGFSDIHQGELVDNLDRTVWSILRWGCAPTRFAVQTPAGSELSHRVAISIHTTFNDFRYHGVQACLPSAPVECVYVQVTNVRLKKRAPNQPAGLPSNAICLPRVAVQVDDPVALPVNASCRKSVCLEIKQVPLRQAIVLTTYSIQGAQFPNYIIAGSAPKPLYVQMSRGTEGIASFTLRRHLDKAFAKAASPSVALAAEMTRLQDCHERDHETPV